MTRSILHASTFLTGGVVALTLGLAHHPVMAQQSTSQTANSLRIEEIVVTARKREESLLDVPLSITALSAAQLERFNLQNMEEISKMTPGLFYTDFGGTGRQDRATSQYVVRGLALNNAGPGTDAATLFIDGVPIGNGNMPGSMDIERIEVLKGPQTAAFGRNTFSGAISVTTRDPGEKWAGGATAEYSKYDSSQVALSVEGPIVEDKVFFRVSGEHRNQGAQYKNSIDSTPLGGQVTSSLWGVVKFVPTDALKIRIVGNAFKFNDDHGAHVRLVAANHNCDPGRTGRNTWFCGIVPKVSEADTHFLFLDQRWRDLVFPLAHFKPSITDDPGVTSHTIHASGEIDYTFSNGLLFEARTGYNTEKEGNISQEWYNPRLTNRFYTGPADPKRNTWSWLYLLEGQSHDFSQEVRLSSDSNDRLRWSFGGNYVNAVGVAGLLGDVPLGAPLILPGSRRQSKTPSAFGSIYYDVLSNLELGLEGRYQKDKIFDTPNFWTPTPSTTLVGKWTAFTPRVSLKYKPNDDTTIFALWARGSRPGAFNAALAPGAQPAGTQAAIIAATGAKLEVDQETINSYELGVKAKFLDGRGQGTLTGYTGAITDQQIAQGYVVAVPTVNIGTVLVNQGRTKLSGIEADVSFQVTDELLVSAAYSVNNTKITRGNDTSVAILRGGNTNVLGNRLPKTPKDQGNTTFTYTTQLNDTFDWYVGGSFIYVGGKFPETANLVSTGSQKLVNARLGVENETMKIELWGKNIFDDRTPDQMFVAFDYDTFTSAALNIGLPTKATYGVRMNYKF
jgi:iron complex outermembrane recepter protein